MINTRMNIHDIIGLAEADPDYREIMKHRDADKPVHFRSCFMQPLKAIFSLSSAMGLRCAPTIFKIRIYRVFI